ncbi:Acyl-CoA N-acyltransferase [Beauveria bassiana ARSEF 2860]|uniref:Acyl-CoA N-acyltransferase n=1 Tax=Beauveria bassiana (strain ARSEF 2860) TaxID=655819 RepID=J5JKY2_BEAB2|nr:Acyl-CoA N-acyltransferase [Beauveria bassiana ARSEF 2860]EJP63846.1 Acyl-CoA N-acyltransferase [Beauveria bassiana ARSEF 2860]
MANIASGISSNQDALPMPPDFLNVPQLAICPPAPLLRPPPRFITTDGIITLRRWRFSDASALIRITSASRSRLAAWIAWPWRSSPCTLDEAMAFTQQMAQRWDEGQSWEYAITVQGEGEEEEEEEVVIGSCRLRRREDHPGVDAGYWLAESSTNMGYATRAVKLLVEEAWRMDAVSVRIVPDRGDGKGRDVLERLGFECQGEVDTGRKEDERMDMAWIKYAEP